MRNILSAIAAVTGLVLAGAAVASEPVTLSDTQLDAVSAGLTIGNINFDTVALAASRGGENNFFTFD